MELKIFENENLIKGAELAIKHRLYVSGWQLIKNLRNIVNEEQSKDIKKEIVLAFIDDIPVGILYRETFRSKNRSIYSLYHHFFIRGKFRGLGIARKMFEYLPRPKQKHKLFGTVGTSGTEKFFRKLDEKFIVYDWTVPVN
jgi:GNAT superfamily N-acetyltransferase